MASETFGLFCTMVHQSSRGIHNTHGAPSLVCEVRIISLNKTPRIEGQIVSADWNSLRQPFAMRLLGRDGDG
jgi:hypothetical protein